MQLSGTDADTDTSDVAVPENETLFQTFDQQVKEQRLYLDYQLTRDDYAQLMGVDRNRFANILKLFTTGGNLSCYLNDLRLGVFHWSGSVTIRTGPSAR